MTTIFISYRRSDSFHITTRIDERLERGFARRNVFFDIDATQPGDYFDKVIFEEVTSCQVMLVIIGPNWLNAIDKNGNRRLDDPKDFVRREIEHGLIQKNTLVIPVLVDDANMPLADELPDSLKELATIHAHTINNKWHFRGDVHRLCRSIRRGLHWGELVGRRWLVVVLLALIIAAISLIIVFSSEITKLFSTATPTMQLVIVGEMSPTVQLVDAITLTLEFTASITPTLTPSWTPIPTNTPVFALTEAVHQTATQSAVYVQETTGAATADSQVQAITQQYLIEQVAMTYTQAALEPTLTAQSWTATYTPTPTPTLTPSASSTLTTTATLTPIPITSTPVPTMVTNGQWSQQINIFAGIEMVLVPPGCFAMGSNTGLSDEQPRHPYCFGQPFWIGRYEVTNGQFQSSGRWASANLPRETVSWVTARNFCRDRGERLPTEVEWEYAAQGPDSLIYPWGNNFVGSNVVYWVNSGGHTAPVGSRSDGVSWVGAHDMSGNVWEWTRSLYMPYPYDPNDGREISDTQNPPTDSSIVIRGGSLYSFNIYILRAANRGRVGPFGKDFIGFRCVRDANG